MSLLSWLRRQPPPTGPCIDGAQHDPKLVLVDGEPKAYICTQCSDDLEPPHPLLLCPDCGKSLHQRGDVYALLIDPCDTHESEGW